MLVRPRAFLPGLCLVLVLLLAPLVIATTERHSLPSECTTLKAEAHIEGAFLILRSDESLPHGMVEVDILNDFGRDPTETTLSSENNGEDVLLSWTRAEPSFSTVSGASGSSPDSSDTHSSSPRLSGGAGLAIACAVGVSALAGFGQLRSFSFIAVIIVVIICGSATTAMAQRDDNPTPLGGVHIILRINPQFAASLTEIQLVSDRTMIGLEVDRQTSINVRCSPSVENGLCFTPLCDFGSDACVTDAVRIGLLLDTEGEASFFGQQIFFAAQEAIAELPLPAPIQFWSGTTGDNNPEDTVSVVNQMYSEGVRLFVGPTTSSDAEAIIEWISDREESDDDFEEVTFLSPDVSSTAIRDSDSIFSLVMDNTGAAHAMLLSSLGSPALAAGAGTKQAILVHRDDRFAQNFANIVASLSDTYGFEITSRISYGSGTIASAVDALPLVTEMEDAATGVDLVIVLGFDEVQWILDASQSLAPSALSALPWTGSGFCLSQAMLRADLEDFTASLPLSCVTYQGASVTDNDRRITLLESISSHFDSIASGLAPTGYDAILLVLATTRVTQTQEISSLRSAIVLESAQTFATTGYLRLNEFGTRVEGDYSIFTSVNATDIFPSEPVALMELVSLQPKSSGGVSPFRSSVQQVSTNPIIDDIAEGCPVGGTITIAARGLSFIEETTVLSMLADSFPLVPAYSTTKVTFDCAGDAFVLTCPSIFFGSDAGCEFEGQGAARDQFDKVINCAVASLTAAQQKKGNPAASVIFGTAAFIQCGKAALEACCCESPDSWCCDVPFIDCDE